MMLSESHLWQDNLNLHIYDNNRCTNFFYIYMPLMCDVCMHVCSLSFNALNEHFSVSTVDFHIAPTMAMPYPFSVYNS